MSKLKTPRAALSLPLPLTHLKKVPKTLERRSISRFLLVVYLLVTANKKVNHFLILVFIIIVIASLSFCKELLYLLLLLRLLLVFKFLKSFLCYFVSEFPKVVMCFLVPAHFLIKFYIIIIFKFGEMYKQGSWLSPPHCATSVHLTGHLYCPFLPIADL